MRATRIWGCYRLIKRRFARLAGYDRQAGPRGRNLREIVDASATPAAVAAEGQGGPHGELSGHRSTNHSTYTGRNEDRTGRPAAFARILHNDRSWTCLPPYAVARRVKKQMPCLGDRQEIVYLSPTRQRGILLPESCSLAGASGSGKTRGAARPKKGDWSSRGRGLRRSRGGRGARQKRVEGIWAHGLDQMGVEARFLGAAAILFLAIACHGHQEYFGRGGLLP
jgi:hypothetical protein